MNEKQERLREVTKNIFSNEFYAKLELIIELEVSAYLNIENKFEKFKAIYLEGIITNERDLAKRFSVTTRTIHNWKNKLKNDNIN